MVLVFICFAPLNGISEANIFTCKKKKYGTSVNSISHWSIYIVHDFDKQYGCYAHFIINVISNCPRVLSARNVFFIFTFGG